MLLLPARCRVLVLGLAGGSVAQALRALAPRAAIVGVELDRAVLRAARRHFGLDALRLRIVNGDALRYLRRERGRFDLVVEDLFVGRSADVHKPDWLAGEGYRLIRRRLAPHGFVVANTIHETPAIVRAMRPFGRVVSMAVRGHWNHVVVAGRDLPAAAALRRRLGRSDTLRRVLPRLALRTVSGD